MNLKHSFGSETAPNQFVRYFADIVSKQTLERTFLFVQLTGESNATS